MVTAGCLQLLRQAGIQYSSYDTTDRAKDLKKSASFYDDKKIKVRSDIITYFGTRLPIAILASLYSPYLATSFLWLGYQSSETIQNAYLLNTLTSQIHAQSEALYYLKQMQTTIKSQVQVLTSCSNAELPKVAKRVHTQWRAFGKLIEELKGKLPHTDYSTLHTRQTSLVDSFSCLETASKGEPIKKRKAKFLDQLKWATNKKSTPNSLTAIIKSLTQGEREAQVQLRKVVTSIDSFQSG